MKKLGFLVAFVSIGAMADVTVCKMGETTRRVEVVHQDGDSSKPCEVKYTKEGGEEKVLWKYNVEVAKCQEQASAFVQKLSGMGYNCSVDTATP